MLLNTMITSEKDSIMIPIPQYPLYSAAISLYGGHACPYYLNEEKGWQLDLD
jgi:alanine transaminase